MRLQLRRKFMYSRPLSVRHDFPWCEIARVRIHVADLRLSDDLPLGITRGDLVALGDVSRASPLAGKPVAVAELEEFEATHTRTMPEPARSVQRLSLKRPRKTVAVRFREGQAMSMSPTTLLNL